MPLAKPHAHYGLLICLGVLIGYTHLFVPRYDSTVLVPIYFFCFGIFYWIIRFKNDRINVKQIFAVGICLRLLMFAAYPGLSEDFYRFIWDGRLINEGVHPFLYLPSDIIANKSVPGLDRALFDQLNSPDYFTVYPSVAQLIFYLSTVFGMNEIWLEALAMRAILLLFDIGSMYLLVKLLPMNGVPKNRLSWFAFNPLLILELIGNLHFEGAMIFFLLLFIYLYQTKRIFKASIALAFAVSTKVIPLIFLPYVFFKEKKGKGILFAILVAITCLILAIPLLSASFIEHLRSSIMLFINSFEFNASIYFLVREVGIWITGYNRIDMIGPGLGVVVFCVIMLFSFFSSKKGRVKLPSVMVVASTIYLLFATTVHPWYVLPLFTISILTNFKYPMLWTALIFFSYIGYTQEGYKVAGFWLVVEYIPLIGYILYEFYSKADLFRSDGTHDK